LHRRIGCYEFFERREMTAVIFEAANVEREGAVHDAVIGKELKLVKYASAVLRNRKPRLALHLRIANELSRFTTNIGPAAEQVLPELGDIYVRRNVLDVGVSVFRFVNFGDGHGLYLTRLLANFSARQSRNFTDRWHTCVSKISVKKYL
jgi:hypothetical protein